MSCLNMLHSALQWSSSFDFFHLAVLIHQHILLIIIYNNILSELPYEKNLLSHCTTSYSVCHNIYRLYGILQYWIHDNGVFHDSQMVCCQSCQKQYLSIVIFLFSKHSNSTNTQNHKTYLVKYITDIKLLCSWSWHILKFWQISQLWWNSELFQWISPKEKYINTKKKNMFSHWSCSLHSSVSSPSSYIFIPKVSLMSCVHLLSGWHLPLLPWALPSISFIFKLLWHSKWPKYF